MPKNQIAKFLRQAIPTSLAALLLLNLHQPLSCLARDNTSQPAVPGVTFTKIQDLDPNKESPNRPIKQKWAVIINLSKYKERRLALNDPMLDDCGKEFRDYLIDEHGGRFSAKHVRLLNNMQATRQNIINSIGDKWLGPLAKPDDLVVVFISTNSFPTTDGSAYLCTYDTALDNVYGTCISIGDVMDTIRQHVKAERIVLVLQAAYSGTAHLSEGTRQTARNLNVDTNKVTVGTGFIILSSSQPDQMSWGNIFSKNLIAALKDKDGLISLGEAFQKARAKTEVDTEHGRNMAKQTPVLKADWKGHALIVGNPAVEEQKDIPLDVTTYLSAEAYYFRANDLITQGKLDEAIEQYKSAIDADPTYSDALADYGATLALKKQFDQAASMYVKAVNLRPKDALYRANYARILAELGRADDSKQQLKEAYQINPRDKVVLTALASLEMKDKNNQAAIGYLQEALNLYPQSSELADRLSFAFAQSGDIAQALEYAQKAVGLDPQSLSARLNLGSALVLAGNLNQATKAYIEATKLAPSDANAHYLLAKTLARSGDRAGAKDELQLFLNFASPSDPRRKQAEEQLSSM